MIEVIRIRVHVLNGTSIITEDHKLDAKNKRFSSPEELEAYRSKKEIKLQWKSDQRYRTENPSETEEDIQKHAPKLSVLIDTRSKDGYIQRPKTIPTL